MHKTNKGITLIELLVVMVIIAMFATLVGSRVFRNVEKGRRTVAQEQITEFESVLDLFRKTGTVRICEKTCRWIPGDAPTFTSAPASTATSICFPTRLTVRKAATATPRTSRTGNKERWGDRGTDSEFSLLHSEYTLQVRSLISVELCRSRRSLFPFERTRASSITVHGNYLTSTIALSAGFRQPRPISSFPSWAAVEY
jgi:prepilin-type N-terminal cleavage/methylation domain-containing protein